MAVSGATLGHGGVIRVGRGATPTWTTMIGVGDFTMPDGSVEDIDVTSHSSPAGEIETVPGLLDRGVVGFDLDYVPDSTTDVCLTAIKASRELVQLEMKVPGGDPEVFAAYLKSYKRSIPVKGVMRASVEFKIAGRVV